MTLVGNDLTGSMERSDQIPMCISPNINIYFEKFIKKTITYYFCCFRFLVRVSYLEIYNENVRDLLGKDQNAKLEVRCFCS